MCNEWFQTLKWQGKSTPQIHNNMNSMFTLAMKLVLKQMFLILHNVFYAAHILKIGQPLRELYTLYALHCACQ